MAQPMAKTASSSSSATPHGQRSTGDEQADVEEGRPSRSPMTVLDSHKRRKRRPVAAEGAVYRIPGALQGAGGSDGDDDDTTASPSTTTAKHDEGPMLPFGSPRPPARRRHSTEDRRRSRRDSASPTASLRRPPASPNGLNVEAARSGSVRSIPSTPRSLTSSLHSQRRGEPERPRVHARASSLATPDKPQHTSKEKGKGKAKPRRRIEIAAAPVAIPVREGSRTWSVSPTAVSPTIQPIAEESVLAAEGPAMFSKEVAAEEERPEEEPRSRRKLSAVTKDALERLSRIKGSRSSAMDLYHPSPPRTPTADGPSRMAHPYATSRGKAVSNGSPASTEMSNASPRVVAPPVIPPPVVPPPAVAPPVEQIQIGRERAPSAGGTPQWPSRVIWQDEDDEEPPKPEPTSEEHMLAPPMVALRPLTPDAVTHEPPFQDEEEEPPLIIQRPPPVSPPQVPRKKVPSMTPSNRSVPHRSSLASLNGFKHQKRASVGAFSDGTTGVDPDEWVSAEEDGHVFQDADEPGGAVRRKRESDMQSFAAYQADVNGAPDEAFADASDEEAAAAFTLLTTPAEADAPLQTVSTSSIGPTVARPAIPRRPPPPVPDDLLDTLQKEVPAEARSSADEPRAGGRATPSFSSKLRTFRIAGGLPRPTDDTAAASRRKASKSSMSAGPGSPTLSEGFASDQFRRPSADLKGRTLRVRKAFGLGDRRSSDQQPETEMELPNEGTIRKTLATPLLSESADAEVEELAVVDGAALAGLGIGGPAGDWAEIEASHPKALSGDGNGVPAAVSGVRNVKNLAIDASQPAKLSSADVKTPSPAWSFGSRLSSGFIAGRSPRHQVNRPSKAVTPTSITSFPESNEQGSAGSSSGKGPVESGWAGEAGHKGFDRESASPEVLRLDVLLQKHKEGERERLKGVIESRVRTGA